MAKRRKVKTKQDRRKARNRSAIGGVAVGVAGVAAASRGSMGAMNAAALAQTALYTRAAYQAAKIRSSPNSRSRKRITGRAQPPRRGRQRRTKRNSRGQYAGSY